MTTTSQALSGVEAAKYKQIRDKFAALSEAEQEALAKEQASIVTDAINADAGAKATVQKKMADLIRERILGNPKFNK